MLVHFFLVQQGNVQANGLVYLCGPKHSKKMSACSNPTSCRRSLVLAKKAGGPQTHAWQPLGRRGPITSAVQGVEVGSRVTLLLLERGKCSPSSSYITVQEMCSLDSTRWSSS